MRVPRLASVVVLLVLGLVALPGAPAAEPVVGGATDWTQVVGCDGTLPREGTFVDPLNPMVVVQVDSFCAADVAVAAGEGGSVGIGPSGLTDCARTTYGLLSYKWFVPYTAQVDVTNPSGLSGAGVLAAFQGAFETWDAATGAEIAGPIVQGGNGASAGVLDGAHQMGWKPLAGGTIAVTVTWFAPTILRPALESDAAYNSNYAWGLGAAGAYDVQAIATHEAGHAFGLGDLYNGADSCLTMYGYGFEGATSARTLGDGDVLGIRHLYGA